MNCQEVQPFVSALHDGESVSREAANHIRNCSECRARLEDYARMGVELRLLSDSAPEEAPIRLPYLRPHGRRWGRILTARVLVPRFALGVAVFAIVGLSVGLGWMRAQSSGPWFQFDVSNPETQETPAKVGTLIQVGEPERELFLSAGPHKKIAIRVKALEAQNDAVRLVVQARVFEPVPGSEEDKVANYQGGVVSPEVVDRIFANSIPRKFDYVAGQTLEIPVEGGGKILLKGEVFKLRPSFSAEWFPATPKPDEIVLSKAALVRGTEFLGEVQGSGSGQATNSAFGICVPPLGAFVFALKPFEGAVKGVAEFGQARFEMDGYEYTLFSATPITGGQQPREIWVYRGQNCPRSWPALKSPRLIGVGDVSNILDALRK
ncbi:MAG TPA: hypothetical protein VG204_00315 [Terriglobia bacterium]|nr:hypothetical protein [Terriglobia bacterium]